MPDVVGERGDRAVALLRVLLQRLGDNVVEVATKQAAELLRCYRASGRVAGQRFRRQRPGRDNRIGEPPRGGVDDNLDQLGG